MNDTNRPTYGKLGSSKGSNRMFQVNVRNMETVSGQLQGQIRRMSSLIGEVSDVKTKLSSMSGFGDVTGTVQNIMTRMEEERRDQNKLLGCLESVAKSYHYCETNIVEHAEGTKIIPRMNTGWITITAPTGFDTLQKQVDFIY